MRTSVNTPSTHPVGKSHQGPEKARAGGKCRLMPCFLSDGTEETPAGWQSEGNEVRRAEALAEFWGNKVPSAPSRCAYGGGGSTPSTTSGSEIEEIVWCSASRS